MTAWSAGAFLATSKKRVGMWAAGAWAVGRLFQRVDGIILPGLGRAGWSEAHMSPRPAMLTVLPALTTTWSSTRTPTSFKASTSSLVMARSAPLGSGTPEG
jgi:hypothetical protein